MRADLLQDSVQILQGVSVDEAPPGGITLAQVVCVLQADTPAGAAVTLQPAAVQVQVADCTFCLVFIILVETSRQISAPGALHT